MAEEGREKSSGCFQCVACFIAFAAALTLASFDTLPKMPLSPITRMAQRNCFLYFAYGSNLLKERIHFSNPSAKMISVGKLKNYHLDFNHFSQRWKGAVATIVEDPGSHVYGVLWEIADEDKANLDKQEGVHNKVYQVLDVEVEMEGGDCVRARSYQIIRPMEDDRRPSLVYMNVIIRGAQENGLPEDYIKFLEGIEHNGYNGSVDLSWGLKK